MVKWNKPSTETIRSRALGNLWGDKMIAFTEVKPREPEAEEEYGKGWVRKYQSIHIRFLLDRSKKLDSNKKFWGPII